MSRGAALALCLALVAPAPGARADEPADEDLSAVDLSGEWYVLVHYRDARSEDESIVKFKDFAWSIRQDEGSLTLAEFPYVTFGEELERVRRRAMREHLAWEPDADLWRRIRESIAVSARAASTARLRGSVAEGYASPPPSGPGSIHTLSFSRLWRVSFGPARIRLAVTDSLSGSASLESLEGSTRYDVVERVAADELRGVYEESTRRGTFRMVRSLRRDVVQ